MTETTAPMNTKGISIHELGVTFTPEGSEPVEALRPTSMEIEPGEFIALVGPSGCGKSTLLNVLAGFIKPSVGRALVGGDPITKPNIDHGMVFQDYALFPWLNVIDNVAFGLERQGMALAERHDRAREYLEMVGLKDFADKPAGQLSQGYRRRLALARATIHSPSLLLLDEPADGLDPQGTEHLHARLKTFAEQGGAVVLTSHRMEEVERLCGRVLLLSEGGIILQGTPEELARQSEGKGLRDLVLGLQEDSGE